jgi:hypothetical protein
MFHLELDFGTTSPRTHFIGKKENFMKFIVDDKTLIKVGNEFVCLLLTVTELKDKTILRISISYEKGV